MAFEPINRSQVVAALKEHGPMTRYELADHLGWPVKKAGTTISSTRNLKPGQVLRIVSYRIGVRVVAVFAAEAGEDAAPPPINKKRREKQKNARYRNKHRATINAKARIKNAERAGVVVAVNPWINLAPPDMRATMARVHRQEAGMRACR